MATIADPVTSPELVKFTKGVNPRYFDQNQQWFETRNTNEAVLTDALLKLLPSIYDTNIPSTRYALHYRALAQEMAQLLLDTQGVVWDAYGESARLDMLWRNLGYLLGKQGDGFPPYEVDLQTNEDYRDLLLALRTSLLGGSTYDSILAGLQLFLGPDVQLFEEYLESSDLGQQFKFRVQVLISDDAAGQTFLTRAWRNAQKLLAVIKPAHCLGRIVPTFVEEFHLGDCVQETDSEGNVVLYSGAEHPFQGPFTTNDLDLDDYYMSEDKFMSVLQWMNPQPKSLLNRSGYLNFDYTGNRFLWPKKISGPDTICEAVRIYRKMLPYEVYDLGSIGEAWPDFKITLKEDVVLEEEVGEIEFILGPSPGLLGALNEPVDVLGPMPGQAGSGTPSMSELTVEYTPN